MGKRLPKPLRYTLFGVLGLLLFVLSGLGVLAYLLPPEPPEPFTVDPRVWYTAAAGEPIDLDGCAFSLPVVSRYARFDGAYGPDLDGVIILRDAPNSPRQLVVGRISRLRPETTIGHDRFGEAFLRLARETREWEQETRLVVFEADEPEYFPDRYAGLHLGADLYFFDDGLLRDRDVVRAVLDSVEVAPE